MLLGILWVGAGAFLACSEPGDHLARSWDGQVDTLADGRVDVQNRLEGVWPAGYEWRVTEELRIGTRDGEGPESFGDVVSFVVDSQDRVWVLDRLALQLHAFDRWGQHLKTLGGEGSGPGEFRQPVHVDIGPEGELWVVDPGNSRISVFDLDGTYVRSIRVPSPLAILPWPGGFDDWGRFHMPVVRRRPAFRIDLARFDGRFRPLDTLRGTTDPIEREQFSIEIDGREVADEPVPFQGGLVWRLSPTGTIWTLLTDEYRLAELDVSGDTLRVVTKQFTPYPVTEEARREALVDLEPFVARGGRVDPERIPSHRPAVRSFFLTEDKHVWVERALPEEREGMEFDVFDPTGRYLGLVRVPFRLQSTPRPIVGPRSLYGIARDEFGVQFVVRARIVK